jgi:hypothetical protein
MSILQDLKPENMKYDNDFILYQLTIEDAQTVAEDILERELTQEELGALDQHFANVGLPDWYTQMTHVILSVVQK